jgi:hypothetical protein
MRGHGDVLEKWCGGRGFQAFSGNDAASLSSDVSWEATRLHRGILQLLCNHSNIR